MDAPKIRNAEPRDIDALVAIENAAFQTDRLSRRSLRALISKETTAIVVAELDSRVAGYAALLFRAGSRTARLYSIAVASEFGGRRIGGQLLAAAEAEALRRGRDRLRLEVRADNGRAAALYRDAGYHPNGERTDYYEDGATALRFTKELLETQTGKPSPVS